MMPFDLECSDQHYSKSGTMAQMELESIYVSLEKAKQRDVAKSILWTIKHESAPHTRYCPSREVTAT